MGSMRCRLLPALVAMTLLVGCSTKSPEKSVTTAPAASVTHGSARTLIAQPRTDGQWPGPNGLSGVNGDPGLDTASVEAFCTARGRPCTIAHTYTDRASYPSMTSGSAWTLDNFADFPGALVISQGLVPEGGESQLAGCAAGDYDDQWRAFGALLVRHGRGDSVVRLGWEFNVGTMPWRGTDTTTYVNCFRRAVSAMREKDPQVLIDWTINGHRTPAGLCDGLSTNCYPGDDYVDVIGIDNYDHYPAATSKAVFEKAATAPEGLTWLYDFAHEHGKLFSVGEWGVVSGTGGGGDNPDFVTWMHAWFAAHATELAYEAYFSNCDQGGVQSSLYSTTADCTRNPESAGLYRTLFGS